MGDRAVTHPEPRSLGKWRSLSGVALGIFLGSGRCDVVVPCTSRAIERNFLQESRNGFASSDLR